MGTRVPSPIVEKGDDCVYCTPALWSAGETPQFVYLTFSGVLNCGLSHHGPENGRTFKLEQDPVNYCYWVFDDGIYHVRFWARYPGESYGQVRLSDHAGWCFFISNFTYCPPDLTVVSNAQNSCILSYAGAGGHCIISYMDTVAWLALEFGLEPGPDLFSELFLHPDGHVVVKLCNRKLRTNIAIKL